MRLAWLGMTAMVGAAILMGGCSSTRAGDNNEKAQSITQAIQGGDIDSTHTYAVGVCSGVNGQCFGRCSGALILPNLDATARHCVDDINYTNPEKHIICAENPTFGGRKGGFYVTTNTTMSSFQNAPGFYAVQSVAVPSDNKVCGGDIALLTLTNSVPANIATPVVPNVQYLMWDPARYVPVFAAIGYGNTTATGNDSGTRRIRQLISVFCIPGDTEHPKCPNGPPPQNIDPLSLISPKEFIGGSGTCSGDSGSSAYEQSSFDKNAPVSFGVLSRGGEDGTKCEGSVYTRLDSYRDLILQTAKTASANWTKYPEPSWTGPVVLPAPKVDGGTPPKKDGGKTSSGGGGLQIGEACETVTDCATGVCSDPGDGSLVCTQSCDESDATSCPDGFQCRESLCLPATTAPTSPTNATTTTTEGCSAASSSSSTATSWGWMALGVSLLLAARRKRIQ
jgi:MYXO-CTERM domain-containing protein